MSEKRYALFIGRWQPPHPGHEWLIRQKLDEGVPCLIAVRPTNEYLKTHEVVVRLERLFKDEDVVVFILPEDIESVNYGRNVGYSINLHIPPDDIAAISGTAVREDEIERRDAAQAHKGEVVEGSGTPIHNPMGHATTHHDIDDAFITPDGEDL